MKLSRKSILIGGFVLAAVFIVYGLIQSFFPDKPEYEFVVAERRTIIQEVSVTGRVKPAESVDLAFERSGKIASVLVKINDRVTAGQSLVSLGSRELSADLSRAVAAVESARAGLAQYQAAVDREQARLDDLRSGSREEELRLAETRVANAEKALADTRENLEQTTNKAAIDLVNVYEAIKDILQDSYAKADDALSRQTNPLFNNDATLTPELTFNTFSFQTKTLAERERVSAGQALEQMRPLLNIQALNLVNLEAALKSGRQNLVVIRDFLQRTNQAVSDAATLSQTQIDSYRIDISAALASINTALASMNTQEQKIAVQKVISQNNLASAEARVNDSESAVAAAQAELNLKRAGASAQELAGQEAVLKQAQASVAAQQAQVRQAQASVAAVSAQLESATIRSPFNGVVTRQDAKLGEIISPSMPVVSVISEAKFEIEANVPEIDVAKIRLANSASVTLDAYGGDVVFSASIVSIDPAETIIEGVSTYKVKLQFSEEDERIKSGMTANVTVRAAEREGVLTVPQRAVIEQDGKKIVRLLRGEGRKQKIEEVEVKIGLRGSDGNIEIIEGISEGDKVVVGEPGKK